MTKGRVHVLATRHADAALPHDEIESSGQTTDRVVNANQGLPMLELAKYHVLVDHGSSDCASDALTSWHVTALIASPWQGESSACSLNNRLGGSLCFVLRCSEERSLSGRVLSKVLVSETILVAEVAGRGKGRG